GGYATEVVEPFIILSGKGLKKEQIAEGVRITNAFQLKQIEEYFERLAKCGLPERRERSRLWRLVDLNRQAMAAIAPSTSVPHAWQTRSQQARWGQTGSGGWRRERSR